MVQFPLGGLFSLGNVPLDQKFVLSTGEEFVFVFFDSQAPEFIVEVSLHDDVGRLAFVDLDDLASSGADKDVVSLFAD